MDKIKSILKKAIDITRWAEKSDIAFPFLEDGEIETIADNILKELDKSNYKITKK